MGRNPAYASMWGEFVFCIKEFGTVFRHSFCELIHLYTIPLYLAWTHHGCETSCRLHTTMTSSNISFWSESGLLGPLQSQGRFCAIPCRTAHYLPLQGWSQGSTGEDLNDLSPPLIWQEQPCSPYLVQVMTRGNSESLLICAWLWGQGIWNVKESVLSPAVKICQD